jgi:histidine phosphotransfer protein HptB
MQPEPASIPIFSTFADDPDLIDLIEMYVGVLPERLAAMRQALEQSDIEQLRMLAHQMKGSGGSHGFTVLSEKAAEVEKSCKAQSLDEIQAGLNDLAVLISRVKVKMA